MIKRIHFIGIGGIGVSSLTQYYLAQKAIVSGSDLEKSEITDYLKKKGAKIFIGNKKEDIHQDLDLVIYTPAVGKDNPELKQAKRLKIKTLSYPEALGLLTKKHFTIAVSGAHGKSTTTAMLAKILIEAKLDPTVIIGTKLKEFGDTNFRAGSKNILLIEADEFQASFLNYWPKIIIVTNIEAEHLDYYKNLNNVLKAFKKFVSHLGAKGILIANQDNENVLKIAKGIKKTIFYSFNQKKAALLKLKVPGSYNISNALAALYCARALKIPDKVSFKALSEYRGAWRRMETHQAKLKGRNITVISDYGHHPTEIAVTISAIKEKYHGKGIWLIFQPHQYQRTFYLFNDFVRALNGLGIEKILLAPIYGVAGRETQALIQKISSEKLASKIAMATAMTDFKTIEKYILDKFDKDLLVFMGAGDIYLLAQRFFKNR